MGTNRDSIHSPTQKILTYQTFEVYHSKRKHINWPLVLDENLAKLLGILIHNGKVARTETLIIVRNTTKFALMESMLIELLTELELTLNTNARQSQGLFKTQAPLIVSAGFTKTFLNILECDRLIQLIGVQEIPRIINDSPLSVQNAFALGYLMTCPVQLMKEPYELKFLSIVPVFMHSMCRLLNRLNIKACVKDLFLHTDLNLGDKLEDIFNETR